MVNLNEIVTGQYTRKWLELYLNNYPTSYHPYDIERLDYFIIALHRYRSHYSLSNLEKHLKEDLGWSEYDVNFCIQRISSGLAVLNARLTFGGSYFNSSRLKG